MSIPVKRFSAVMEHVGAHDRVRVWNRGGFAGELVVNEGDGVALLELLEGVMCQDRIKVIEAMRESASILRALSRRPYRSYPTGTVLTLATYLEKTADLIEASP